MAKFCGQNKKLLLVHLCLVPKFHKQFQATKLWTSTGSARFHLCEPGWSRHARDDLGCSSRHISGEDIWRSWSEKPVLGDSTNYASGQPNMKQFNYYFTLLLSYTFKPFYSCYIILYILNHTQLENFEFQNIVPRESCVRLYDPSICHWIWVWIHIYDLSKWSHTSLCIIPSLAFFRSCVISK